MARTEGAAVWCGPSDAGMSDESVARFVDRAATAGFTTIVMEVKGGHGLVRYPCAGGPDLTEPGYEEFDLPALLLRECRRVGLEFHAWFIDYMEGEGGPAYRDHPEWAATDADGKPTSEAVLRGSRYGAVWMCPSRRPGYTDQWLIPLICDFAERYDVDAIHHDYIRYPGDLAPDTYCFCDHCLEDIPQWAGYVSDAYPDEPFTHESYDRPYLESHWEQSPRVLPAKWDRLSRSMKSRFLLHGGFFHGSLADLDHFYYCYRMHWITAFARECAEVVRRIRPSMEFSAAVFKNPIHSGRFIGQDWRTFAPWVEHCMPMDYRDHFPGTFDQYLDLLAESITRQKEWARGFRSLWPGFAVNFLYKEETEARVTTDRWPREKLRRTVERIRSTGVSGLSVFCAGQLSAYDMWDTMGEALT